MKKVFIFIMLFFAAFNPIHTYCQWTAPWNYITFDSGDTLWQHAITIDTFHYHHNIWQVGEPHKAVFVSAYSLPNAIVTDTLNRYPPNDTSVFLLTFPGNVDSWFQNLSFYYKLNIDSNSIAKIEYSPDSGRTWINLHDSTPYGFKHSATLLTTPGWHWWNIETTMGPMGPYFHNDSLKFKFTFISGNDTLGRDGWMMDNFVVFYAMSGVPTIENNTLINIYPNPSTTSLTISSPDNITTLSITNLLGQTLYNKQYNSPQVQIDVADLPASVYLVRINGTEVRKFVKQ